MPDDPRFCIQGARRLNDTHRHMGYLPKLLTILADRDERIGPGKVTQTQVTHSADCPWLQGGTCVSDPTIRVLDNEGGTA